MQKLVLVGLAIGLATGGESANAFAQPPGPLAIARVDLNGDGKTDEVRVTRAEGIGIYIVGSKTVQFPLTAVSGMKTATVELGTRGSEARILVVATSATEREAVWIGVNRGRVRKLWAAPLGAADEDTGTAPKVGIVDGQLYRYIDNPAVTRCDGKPARLNAETLIGNRFRRAAAPVAIRSDAKTLVASDVVAASSIAKAKAPFFEARSASSAPGVPPDLLTPPTTLRDGKLETAWVASAKVEGGRGEFVTLAATTAQPIRGLRIVAGAAGSPKSFRGHNRPKRIAVVSETGAQFWIELADRPPGTAQWIALPAPLVAQCVSIIIDSVFKGRDQGSRRGTAISELAVLTTLDLDGSVAKELVARLIRGGDSAKTRRELLALGAEAVPALLARIRRGDLGARETLSLRRVLAALNVAPAELAKGLGGRAASERDRDEFGQALVRIGGRSIPALRAIAADRVATREGRQFAARILATIPGQPSLGALTELVRTAGDGSADPSTRAAFARALGSRGVDGLRAALAALPGASGPPIADFYRVIGMAAGKIDLPAERTTAIEALRAGLAKNASYEETYRALWALGRLQDPSAVTAVRDRLVELRERDAKSIALRRVAVRALAENTVAMAADILLFATSDADPGVREAAVSGLAGRELEGDTDSRLGKVLELDRWPDVRRQAAGVLASRCPRKNARDALRQAAEKTNETRVGQIVLTAALQCGGPGLGKLLLGIAKNSKRPTAIRAHAVTLLGQVREPGVSKALIALFEDFTGSALNEPSAVELAQAGAAGLCVSGDVAAVKPLTAAARSRSFPAIATAATRALGCYCSSQTRATLKQLSLSSQIEVARAARQAGKRCASGK